MKRNWLLVFIPVALGLWWGRATSILVFVTSALAIVPLAGLMGDATEALARYLGACWGGLLNASLGNAPEIIISLFALHQGLVPIVKASITGSIVGNLLLGLGISMFTGGLKHGKQTFDRSIASMNAGLLTLAAFGMIIPAVFHYSKSAPTRGISLHIAGVMALVYTASMIYTIITNRPVMGKEAVQAELPAEETKPDPTEPVWSRNQALGMLALVTIALAIMSEVLTDTIQPAADAMGLTPLFAGVFLLAVVSNAAELFNAVRFARKNHMDLALGITVGASIQVALVVAPVLVFAGYFLGKDMDLLFSHFEIVAIALAVIVTRTLTVDGNSNWLEGLMLIAVYFMLGVAFFHLPVRIPAT
jgi:Ca2+:H+ antiporter